MNNTNNNDPKDKDSGSSLEQGLTGFGIAIGGTAACAVVGVAAPLVLAAAGLVLVVGGIIAALDSDGDDDGSGGDGTDSSYGGFG